jgi:hypothetical protein
MIRGAQDLKKASGGYSLGINEFWIEKGETCDEEVY